MMFKGSREVAPGAFSLAVAREGGQDNAFTSRDVTAYHQTVEASRLPLVMRMEADRFAAPLFPAETLEPERAVVLEERRQRTDSNPRARFIEAFDAAMWGPQHWRGRPIIGWEPEIRAITREDMLDFFGRRYAPGNAVLVIAGDVREAEARRLSEELYGAVPARPFAGRDRASPPAAVPQPRLVTRDPTVREALVVRSFVAPSLTWGSAEQAWALEALAHLLGSGPGSRLYPALVETGLATAAGASYDGEVAGAGSFSVSATLRPGVEPERLEAALDAALDALLQEGPTEAERARSVRQITAGAVLTLDSLGGVPRMLGGALAIGLPLELVEYWPRRLRAVTLAQVTEAARAVLHPRAPSTTGWLLPGAPA
jgi:zinc protease